MYICENGCLNKLIVIIGRVMILFLILRNNFNLLKC